MRVFDFSDYKKFVNSRIASMPRRGHGQFRKIAEHLRIHYTMISQVFRGDKDLSSEQALSLCEYLGLSDLETDYFMALVESERAGTQSLKARLNRKIIELREQAQNVGNRLPKTFSLSDADRAIFYSTWYHSALRLMTSIDQFQTVDAMAEHLDLPKNLVNQVIQFLISVGLCVRKPNGKITMGPSRTHIPADSPLVTRHHTNWRLKAIERFGKLSHDELIFTSPLTISTKDAPKVKEILLRAVEEISKIVENTDAQQLSCLNIDWFKVVR